MIAKRLLDLVVALVGLLVTSPVLAATWLIIRRTMGRPVLFRQQRPGLHGEPFDILKFRTMADTVDGSGRLLPDEDRITRAGRFLRSTSLDELPEFLNVLRGEMSVVGPRPLLMEYLELYSPHQARRMEVRPGVTGLAQVSGRNELSWDEKFDLDVWYVDNRTLWLDVKLIAITVWRVITRRGISAEGHATAPFFRGSGSIDPR